MKKPRHRKAKGLPRISQLLELKCQDLNLGFLVSDSVFHHLFYCHEQILKLKRLLKKKKINKNKHFPSLVALYYSSPWIWVDSQMLQPTEHGRSDAGWLWRLGHDRSCTFHFAHGNTCSWIPESLEEKSNDPEASMLWRVPGHADVTAADRPRGAAWKSS